MQPRDLLKTARLLLGGQTRPAQANLRRAISSTYYAMFHCLARSAADLLVGGYNADRSKPAWRQVYRSLEHNPTKGACQDKATIQKFPKPIADFANLFVTMQTKRHAADYDPLASFVKSEALQDIEAVEKAIEDFWSAPVKDRRAFCAFVLFRKRT